MNINPEFLIKVLELLSQKLLEEVAENLYVLNTNDHAIVVEVTERSSWLMIYDPKGVLIFEARVNEEVCGIKNYSGAR